MRVQLSALSEVRPLGRGETRVEGYTYYWSGLTEWHTQGVAIAVADCLLPAVDDIRCVSERQMSLRLRHSQDALTVVSVYAPTDTRGPKLDQDQKARLKDTFYRQLESVVEGRPAGDTPLVLGDFNAQVGSSRAGYQDVIGPHDTGDRPSDNGSRLLHFAKGHSSRPLYLPRTEKSWRELRPCSGLRVTLRNYLTYRQQAQGSTRQGLRP